MDDFTGLQEKIMHLEKHIEEQDAEIYRLARLLERNAKRIEKLESRVVALDSSSQAGGEMPTAEKPPHY
jgi:uncharacterized coiled-coil protein SlyX